MPKPPPTPLLGRESQDSRVEMPVFGLLRKKSRISAFDIEVENSRSLGCARAKNEKLIFRSAS